MSVSVIIASYGDQERWERMSRKAVASATSQVPRPEVIRIHGATLAEARNAGAKMASGNWLCFLDCDDMLEPGYLYAMEEQAGAYGTDSLLLYPMVRRVPSLDAGADLYPAIDLTSSNLLARNYMVIGTLVNSHIFHMAGGFDELEAYEDWDLWLRCVYKLGCTPVAVPGAIYRALVRSDGRNMVSNPLDLCRRILAKNGLCIR